jgi:PncC family amidohydrolase
MVPAELIERAAAVAARLENRGETLAVAESAAGGLISAALVAVPGASAFYRSGLVIYTLDGAQALLPRAPRLSPDIRGANEPFARWLATAAAGALRADWGLGETGAAGPAGNPYGDPPGHAWVACVDPAAGRPRGTCSPGPTTGHATWRPSRRPPSRCSCGSWPISASERPSAISDEDRSGVRLSAGTNGCVLSKGARPTLGEKP